VLGNGVEERLLRAERRREDQTLVFVGGMSYGPNVEGATWLVRAVLPLIRRSHPRSRLLLVGHHPARAVQRLRRVPGVEVTGTVADVVPYLSRAAVFVAPIRLGGGFSNKVAEALAAGVPTVATPAAVEGLPGVDAGIHLLSASEPEPFAAAVTLLLGDPNGAEELGRRGRDLARQRYGWERVVARLEGVYSRVIAGSI
jgi:glycosyltransferase involved in cell wall biosynthesis